MRKLRHGGARAGRQPNYENVMSTKTTSGASFVFIDGKGDADLMLRIRAKIADMARAQSVSEGELSEADPITPRAGARFETGNLTMTKDEWIRRAVERIKPYQFCDPQETAETRLYNHFVVGKNEFVDDPEGAADEYLRYFNG